MSAVVGDVGQIGSLFAGLAAIVTLFLFGASGCEHLFGFSLLIAPPIPQAARRPLNRSMMRTTNATPSNKWIRLPATWRRFPKARKSEEPPQSPKPVALSFPPKKYAGTRPALHKWIPRDLTRNRSERQSDGMCS